MIYCAYADCCCVDIWSFSTFSFVHGLSLCYSSGPCGHHFWIYNFPSRLKMYMLFLLVVLVSIFQFSFPARFRSHSFTCHRHKPYLPLLPSCKGSLTFSWYLLHLPTKGWPGWVDLGGSLPAEINVPITSISSLYSWSEACYWRNDVRLIRDALIRHWPIISA